MILVGLQKQSADCQVKLQLQLETSESEGAGKEKSPGVLPRHSWFGGSRAGGREECSPRRLFCYDYALSGLECRSRSIAAE